MIDAITAPSSASYIISSRTSIWCCEGVKYTHQSIITTIRKLELESNLLWAHTDHLREQVIFGNDMGAGQAGEPVPRDGSEELDEKVANLACHHYADVRCCTSQSACPSQRTGSIVPPARITLLADSTTSLNRSAGLSRMYLSTTDCLPDAVVSQEKTIRPSSLASVRDRRNVSTWWNAAMEACRVDEEAVLRSPWAAILSAVTSPPRHDLGKYEPFLAASSSVISTNPLILRANLLSLKYLTISIRLTWSFAPAIPATSCVVSTILVFAAKPAPGACAFAANCSQTPTKPLRTERVWFIHSACTGFKRDLNRARYCDSWLRACERACRVMVQE